MSKVLIFNFDGTDNEPQDAVQDVKKSGEIEDDNITNILKFHLLLGGDLKEDNVPFSSNGSRCIYYNGVGTYGNYFQRKFNAGLASEKGDVATILNKALADFDTYYVKEGGFDKIILTGFSRGGALARRFAALINDKVSGQIIIEMIYDTVASIGLPNLSSSDRPTTNIVFEDGQTLPSNVEKAIHLVALDDKRRAFQPTLMNKDPRVLEVWFAGAHSDVGGGYYYDGLSDLSLRFFLDWFEDLGLGIKLLSSKTIDYEKISEGEKFNIGPDDVQVDPDPFGVNHQQDRFFLLALATLTDRKCCVIEKDKINNNEEPLIHWSVAERIAGDRTYRPKSLENLKHKIIYPDLTTSKPFNGISDHKKKSNRLFKNPATDGVCNALVFAYQKYNRTGIYLEKGKKYSIEVIELDTYKWNDGGIVDLDGEGWDRGDVRLGLSEIAIAASEPFRRVPDADWFTLCGCIGDQDDEAFKIGNATEMIAPKTGELCAFANDLSGYYGNNSGKLKIAVKQI